MPKIDPRQIEEPTWTPEIVRDRMIEAVRWARYNAGPVGPAPIRSGLPEYRPTIEDDLAEGWGLAGRAVESDGVLRIQLPPDRVDQIMWVLDWCRLYLAHDRPGDAVILNLWLACKVYRTSFDNALKRRGFALSRRHAYRMRDRALSHISQRLDQEGFRP